MDSGERASGSISPKTRRWAERLGGIKGGWRLNCAHNGCQSRYTYDAAYADEAVSHPSAAIAGKLTKKIDKEVQLDDCVRSFTTPEVLSDDNMW